MNQCVAFDHPRIALIRIGLRKSLIPLEVGKGCGESDEGLIFSTKSLGNFETKKALGSPAQNEKPRNRGERQRGRSECGVSAGYFRIELQTMLAAVSGSMPMLPFSLAAQVLASS